MADFDVIVLGAGLGGLGMGVTLRSLGLSFLILEQAGSVGGTWRDNVYPGAACDTESHLYCFSFAPHADVSRIYARQPELRGYAERVARENALGEHIRFGARIVRADWQDEARLWSIQLASGERLTARAFVAAWGQLNRPSVPAIPGLESFAGEAFHSARWRADVPLAGRRVASIGNAASAVQYIPEIVAEVAHLDVFQRSANWVVPRGDRLYTADELALYAAEPARFEADKARLFEWRESQFRRMRQGSEEALAAEAIARAHLEEQVADPSLRAALTPDYPLGCKRVLRSDDYYPALGLDHVDLVTQAIREIVPQGIVTVDGRLHEQDVIIFGTGFETQSFQGPVEIGGSGGRDLRAFWADGVRAYLGITVPHFPNLFLVYGPNTNLGHNSVLAMLEAQFAHIAQLLPAAIEAPIAPDEAILDAFDAGLQAEMVGSAWSGPCASWYKDRHGRVVNNWSGSVEDYRRATAIADLSHYVAA